MSVRRNPEMSQGRTVRYGVFESPLGKTLLAATPAGLCSLAFAEHAEDLLAELQRRLPGCSVGEDSESIARFASALMASLVSDAPLHLPLDVQGTTFQHRVWAALQAIPRGSTQTYTQVTQSLGLSSTSVRAVAQACAANPVAVVIPCHRVVGTKGDLRGYRWGMERKRHLLLLERSPAQRTLLAPEVAMLGLQ